MGRLGWDNSVLEYYQLEQYLLTSPAIHLMRSKNAALVISFLYDQFLQEPKPSIRLVELKDALVSYLDQLNSVEVDRFPRPAEDYLKEWTSTHWLRIVRSDVPDDHVVELSIHTQRVLGWMEELQKRTFVGTESRFLQILDLLEQLAVHGTADKESRLDQLRADKMRIEAEIEKIERTGEVDQYDTRQIRERFHYISTLAGQLLRDFGAVEESFKEIAQQVQLSQLQIDVRKGVVIKQVLDADAALQDSDVGKSFYAFWEYLHLQGHQEKLDEQIEKVFKLEELNVEEKRNTILKGLLGHLIRAGLKVVESNQRLAEQLRRMLDEANMEESRRIRALANEIKALALRTNLADDYPLMDVEGLPETYLPLEQTLYTPNETVHYAEIPSEDGPIELDLDSLGAFFDYFYVDVSKLRDHIAAALEAHHEITLADLLNLYPVERGLSEIVAYLHIASQDDYHRIEAEVYELITISNRQTDSSQHSRRVKVPKIIFQKFSETVHGL